MTAVRIGLVTLAALLAAVVAGASGALFWAAPIALGAGLLLGLATWYRPVVGAVVAVAVVPALSGLARGLVVPVFKLSELLLLLCLAALVLRRPDRWRPATRTDMALVLFAAAAFGFAALHTASGTSTLESLVRVGLQPTFFLIAYWVASRGVQSAGELVTVLRWLLLVSLVPAAIALAQSFGVPGVGETMSVLTGGGFQGVTRSTGPFPIWHSLGGYLLVPSLLASVLMLRGDRRVLPRHWLVLVLLVDLAALVSTITVTFLVWLPVGLLVAAAAGGRVLRGTVLVAVLAAVALVLFPTALQGRLEEQTEQTQYTAGGVLPQTVEYRIFVWERDYLPLIERAPAVGLGNDLPDDVRFPSTENQYITLALRGGVLLPVAMVVALGALTLRAWRHSRAPDVHRAGEPTPAASRSAALTLLGILAFLPLALLVWPYLTNAGLSQTLAAFAGAALALEPRRRSVAAAAAERARRRAALEVG
ncbi:hypothetical protein, partial [Aquipuribacter hungaricus]|uniref:hypothetical protein n=1 Tax=Aquipuribacter hungaricus TaxID=545624 RepID=UPI0030EEF968